MNPLAYCEDKLAHPDSDYPLLRPFLSGEARRLHAGLQTLRLELLGIPDEVADPGVARTKLQWWREELLRYSEGEARHPVTRLLSQHRDRMPPERLLYMTLAVDALLQEGGAWQTFDELHAHCETISGTAAGLEADVSGLDPDAAALAGQMGTAAHMTRLLANLRRDSAGGRPCVPLDEMARFQLKRSDFHADPVTPELSGWLDLHRSRISALYTGALQALSPVQRDTLLSWVIRAHLDLARLSRKPDTRLQPLGPVRRLWIAWRTASRTRRAALAT